MCHGSAYPAPFPITVHALTWFHSSLIEHTCNHLPSPFISSLTSVTHRLILRLHGCTAARLHGCTAAHWSLSACLSWIWSLPKVTRLQGCSSLHWSMSACLPVYPGSGPCLRKRKFTNSWYCSSCFQNILRCLSYVGSPALVIVNKLPFDLHPPVCLLWPVPWQYAILFSKIYQIIYFSRVCFQHFASTTKYANIITPQYHLKSYQQSSHIM